MTLPKISIVTPSFNSGRFMRRTIESILGQQYEKLEYIIQDGGSTDETIDILTEFKSIVAHCTSAPDQGQYDAINKGFALSTGEVMAWLNADDVYLQGTLKLVGKIFEQFPEINWLTTRYPLAIDENDSLISTTVVPGFSLHGFLCGDNLPSMGWEGTAFIQQESTFWRRSLWDRAGGFLDPNLQFAGDFELWARFFHLEELYSMDVPLACFRKHSSQKTSTSFQRYLDEASSVFAKIGGKVPDPEMQSLRLRIATKYLSENDVRFGWQKNLFKPSKRVVYEWSEDLWKIKEY